MAIRKVLGTLALSALFPAVAWAGGSISFEERVKAQGAIEQVYYARRLWPKENPGPKPPFEEAVSHATIAAKVTAYLQQSETLQVFWGDLITGEELQSELDRMARSSKSPDVLLELFSALGNDPGLIAECLARPALAERKLRERYLWDKELHSRLRAEAEGLLRGLTVENIQTIGGPNYRPIHAVLGEPGTPPDRHPVFYLSQAEFTDLVARFPSEGKVAGIQETAEGFSIRCTLQRTARSLEGGAVLLRKRPFSDWFEAEALPLLCGAIRQPEYPYHLPHVTAGRGESILASAPDTWSLLLYFPQPSRGHTVVWTGAEMIIWGGSNGDQVNYGVRFTPSTGTWVPVDLSDTDTPTPREGHTAIWTGEEMIIWGGKVLNPNWTYFASGSKYNPTLDTRSPGADPWKPLPTTSVPPARSGHSAVWTGTQMLIWGGQTGVSTFIDSGGRFDPAASGGAGAWSTMSTTSAPSPRYEHTAVWDGERMVVWGGYGYNTGEGFRKNTGARYNPSTDAWVATATTGAPTRRYGHTALWTGQEMIVWGGSGYTETAPAEAVYKNSGARYNPASNVWTAMANPTLVGRYEHSAVWTGERMIVWGGTGGDNYGDGGLYNPSTNSWSLTSATGAPVGRAFHSAAWTGQEMVIWGGSGSMGTCNDGGRYSLSSNSWSPLTPPSTLPTPRYQHAAAWTGNFMVIWGGQDALGNYLNTGGIYNPATDTWSPTSTGTDCAGGRYKHTAVWDGTNVIFWGGTGCTDPPGCTMSFFLKSGGRFDPTANTWTTMATVPDPFLARESHTAVWTGTGMIVWGGYGIDGDYITFSDGAIYNARDDVWSTAVAAGPTGRMNHTAVWTGYPTYRMLVWGGKSCSLSMCMFWTDHDDGSSYDPATNSWIPLASAGAPGARNSHTAVWTGSEMLVWGGREETGNTLFNDGGIYDIAGSGSWRAGGIPSTGAPSARCIHTATWTGKEMIVWGGYDSGILGALGDGGRFDPGTGLWSVLPATNAPPARYSHTAVWTGQGICIWDGAPMTSSGGLFYPNTAPDPVPKLAVSQAAYDSGMMTPVCGGAGAVCSSLVTPTPGESLVNGRDTISGGNEAHQPNTLKGACADGTSGSYHVYQSLDTLKVYTLDGGAFAVGETVRVEAGVWARNSSDRFDVYYCPDADAAVPAWTFIGSKAASGAGSALFTKDFTLVAGGARQAVRGQFKSGLTASSCVSGVYNDRDDLVFDVAASATPPTFVLGISRELVLDGLSSTCGTSPDTTPPYQDTFDGITSFEWDLDGDARFGSNCNGGSVGVDRTGALVVLGLADLESKGMGEPGEYEIWLRVTDSMGIKRCEMTTLKVADGLPPSVTLATPIGGETWDYSPATTDRRHHLIVWEANDNFPPMGRVKLSYTTDGTTWTCIADSAGTTCPAAGLTPAVGFYDWSMPTKAEATAAGQAFPSVNAKIRVEVWDTSGNAASDQSDTPFYIIQPTAGAVQTLLVTHMGRLTTLYGATAANQVYDKLLELSTHDKVLGTVLNLANAPSLTTPYADWVADPTSVAKANAVADAARAYLVTQLTSTYTNAKFLVIAGDDRVVPHRRVPDSTLTYPETQYVGQVDCASTVGSAICANHYLTDATYGDLAYETTEAGSLWLALPDLAVGRLVETPAQMMDTMGSFIAQNGQVSLNEVLVTGYDFLEDSATAMRDAWLSGGETVDSRLGTGWTSTDLENDLFSSPPHALHNLNDHSDHYTFGTPSGLLTAAQMDTHAGRPLEGSLFYNVGCHSGLSVPPSFANALDLPELMLEKGAAAYVGNTGFGWGLRYGIGYSERLMQLITARLLSQPSYALGTALSDAKRDYFLENHRYDVFDEKSLMESTLYGLPMYEVVVDPASLRVPEKPLSATGPDRQTSGGITALKALSTEALPPGVIQLDLNFDFSAGGVYVKHTTPSGSYYSLSGKTGGEIGDSVQPLFTYDSRLSGTLSHGVVFTGGTYASESGFNPVVGAPASNNPDLGEGPIGPMAGSYIPTVNATHPTLFSFAARGGDGTSSAPLAGATDLTQMTVYTGYIQADVESRFTQMAFTIYYSTSSDKTAPAITDPGPGGDLHDLSGVTCSFSVPASDASGVFRVLVLYDAGLGLWKSLDLAYDAGLARWTGPLELARSTRYVVYAVDNAGNVGYLKDTGSDLDGAGQPTGSTYQGARVFEATLPAGDTDGDGMPDVYEDAHGLDKLVNDAALDPDYDGFANLAEYGATTDPQNPDSDSDGDNDGSEAHNGRNPLNPADGKAVTILAAKSGGDIVISWPPGTGQNALIDGPYWIYRSPDPLFDYQELRPTAPMPLPDGVATWTDTGAAADGQPKYYYAVSNVAAPAPVVDVLSPATGPAAGGTTVNLYGAHFVAPCTVSFGGTPATNVVVVTNTTITCRTPAHAAGAVNVVVTGPSGRTGTKTGGFTYY